jgi:hypothetical protein
MYALETRVRVERAALSFLEAGVKGRTGLFTLAKGEEDGVPEHVVPSSQSVQRKSPRGTNEFLTIAASKMFDVIFACFDSCRVQD